MLGGRRFGRVMARCFNFSAKTPEQCAAAALSCAVGSFCQMVHAIQRGQFDRRYANCAQKHAYMFERHLTRASSF